MSGLNVFSQLLKQPPKSIQQHFEWLKKKRTLKQDVLLLSPPPSHFARNLALEFARLLNYDAEIISLTPDTTEADLKTRRDLVNQSVVFTDQGPVKAALKGRMLILDGLEKCERNVLPTLNNLLENREMNLDDGRFIVSHERYQHLLKSNSAEALQRAGIVPTHPNFFVVALSSPIPPFVGRPLDPPLRSRFQVRRIEFPNPSELVSCDIDPIVAQIGATFNLANENNPSMFPRFSSGNVLHISKTKKMFPDASMLELFKRSYPWLSDEMNFAHQKSLMKVFPASSASISKSKRTTQLSSHKYLAKERKSLVQNMLEDHQSGRDILLCGGPGSGKSFLARLLASEMGYEKVRVAPLHRDMTSRDMVARRVTDSKTGNTSWELSAIAKAAERGELLILDGIEKVDSAILSIARLFQDRQMESMDGVPINIHPKFRVMALANFQSNDRKRQQPSFLTPEILSMFSTHFVPPLQSKSDLLSILTSEFPGVPKKTIESLLNFSLLLEAKGVESGLRALSLRALLLISRRLQAFPDEDSVEDLIKRALLEAFLPRAQRDLVKQLMVEAGLGRNLNKNYNSVQQESANEIEVTAETIAIGPVNMKRFPRKERPDLVPHVLFYDVAHHRKTLRDMLADMASGSRNILLMGNQGVGKNKLTDRLLELLNAEREYVQLHRDSTVASLTGAAAIQNGKVVWEDSPLVRAAKFGRVIVVDEADKAPPEVVAVLKSLVEDGEMMLGSGKRLVQKATGQEDEIPLHPDFCVWILSNRPGFPFHGNDFFKQIGDVFSTHIIENPDLESEVELLRGYAPNTDESMLRSLAKCFADLRSLADQSLISYPYSAREAVNVAKHLDAFPEDGLVKALHNVLDFDSFQPEVAKTLEKVFQKNGIPFSFQFRADANLGAELGMVQPLPELRPSGEKWRVIGE